MSLTLVPMPLDEANEFVRQHHRHHRPVVSMKFCLGAALEKFEPDVAVVGVAIVGRPIARHLDDGWTLEVNRLATDGTKNACSFLYAAAWRATRALGYRKLVTYTLATEGGASLRAAGWRIVGTRARGSWTTPSRPRVHAPTQARWRWEAQ